MDTININRQKLISYKISDCRERIYKDGFNNVNKEFYKKHGFSLDEPSIIDIPRKVIKEGEKVLSEYIEGHKRYKIYNLYWEGKTYEEIDGRTYIVKFYN